MNSKAGNGKAARYLISGGEVVEAGAPPVKEDLLLADERVVARGPSLKPDAATILIDARGCYVLPGLIDMHVHLREPGREDKETIISGTKAAAVGGFTGVCAKANTFLIMDNAAVVEFVRARAAKGAYARVFPVGSVTEGLKGHGNLSDIGSLKEAGVVALSDDGVPVVASDVMAAALRYAADYDLPVIAHSEDYALSRGGAASEGPTATRAGLIGIPGEAEETLVARDLALLRNFGGKLHVAHVSSAGSLTHIRRAKEAGLKVTCEATPHHLLLTEELITGYDADAKMNPPLRPATDREALLAALADGTIDCIASDHAPHTIAEKDKAFALAPFGVVGLETSLRLVFTYLVLPGIISITRMVELMVANPARILDLRGLGDLKVGSWADVTVFDPRPESKITAASFHSKGKNTPFEGWSARGFAKATFVGGRPIVLDGNLIATDTERDDETLLRSISPSEG